MTDQSTSKPEDTRDQPAVSRKKWLRRLAILGGLLGLVCKSLPPDYRVICDTIATICSLGMD